jgi:hypothetical protein
VASGFAGQRFVHWNLGQRGVALVTALVSIPAGTAVLALVVLVWRCLSVCRSDRGLTSGRRELEFRRPAKA